MFFSVRDYLLHEEHHSDGWQEPPVQLFKNSFVQALQFLVRGVSEKRVSLTESHEIEAIVGCSFLYVENRWTLGGIRVCRLPDFSFRHVGSVCLRLFSEVSLWGRSECRLLLGGCGVELVAEIES